MENQLLTITVQATAWLLAGWAAWLIVPIFWRAFTDELRAERFEDVDELAARDREAGL